MERVRGFIDLVFDVVEGTTDLVERTHDAVVERTRRRFAPIEPAKTTAEVVTGIQTTISSLTFGSIRAINHAARVGVDVVADVVEAGLERAGQSAEVGFDTPLSSSAAGTPSWYVDYVQSSLNGFWGDSLSRKQSRLDLGMTFRHQGRSLPVTREALSQAYPNPTRRLCVFVHSLAATEWLWSLGSQMHYGDPDVTFGTRLRDDLGYTPIYVRYNTGRHVSTNGRILAKRLTELVGAYPMPVDEIALVGHSMGGLVARSAAHYAREHDEPWLKALRHVACIGSPHLGAPLEKAAHLLTYVLKRVDAAGAQVPAELLGRRSEGIKDLRHGYTVDEEWIGKDPDAVFEDARRDVPLVEGVGYYFLAATITRDPEHPVGRLLGDLMVRLPSASGEAPKRARRIHFDAGSVHPGMNHIHIANHPEVYQALRDLLAA